jgi:hypothetical protein
MSTRTTIARFMLGLIIARVTVLAMVLLLLFVGGS